MDTTTEKYRVTKNYILLHKKNVSLSAAVILGMLLLIAGLLWLISSNIPKVIYKPVAACELFSMNEAKMLLGPNAILGNSTTPIQSKNTAVSQCGYTDGNPNTASMIVAAVTVRSGVNDKGVEQNKAEFTAGRPKSGIEIIKNLGDSAYFNRSVGQLNILSGKRWVIISYGYGNTPEKNTITDAQTLAQLIL